MRAPVPSFSASLFLFSLSFLSSSSLSVFPFLSVFLLLSVFPFLSLFVVFSLVLPSLSLSLRVRVAAGHSLADRMGGVVFFAQ